MEDQDKQPAGPDPGGAPQGPAPADPEITADQLQQYILQAVSATLGPTLAKIEAQQQELQKQAETTQAQVTLTAIAEVQKIGAEFKREYEARLAELAPAPTTALAATPEPGPALGPVGTLKAAFLDPEILKSIEAIATTIREIFGRKQMDMLETITKAGEFMAQIDNARRPFVVETGYPHEQLLRVGAQSYMDGLKTRVSGIQAAKGGEGLQAVPLTQVSSAISQNRPVNGSGNGHQARPLSDFYKTT